MPLPKDVLKQVKANLDKAEATLAEIQDVVTDMRLAGLDTTKQDTEMEALRDEIRKRRIFYDRQEARSA
ncbi:unnamed protein product [marine sediment metagenome]|uniref:Uncharacterized protein n=1 Tax=marine sediment metagenome TaxID=412755 RepID=X1V6K8_9ZZZZ